MNPAPNSPNFQAELNPEQFAAVTSPGGPTLVIAGAGSGKTRTLIYRVAWLIEQGISPYNILLLTFTNKAAREMTSRALSLVGEDISTMWSGTFHSICCRILRRNADLIGFNSSFSILDRDDQKNTLKRLIQPLAAEMKISPAPKADVFISAYSLGLNRRLPLEKIIESQFPHLIPFLEFFQKLEENYQKHKRATNSMDFDDLLVLTLELFEKFPNIRDIYANRFHHILVDEYQDTNPLQEQIIRHLSSIHQNLMAVGDDAQSIYSWRGAEIDHILQFETNYPNASIFKIETNYRSRPEILALSNESIRQNFDNFPKNLISSRKSVAAKPQIIPALTAKRVAQNVVRLIKQKIKSGIEPSEIAILYRAHYQSMELQMELTRNTIPFFISSGLKFFETAHVKDLTSFLRFAHNLRDEAAFRRMMQLLPAVGEKTQTKLWLDWIKSPDSQATELSLEICQKWNNWKLPTKAKPHWQTLTQAFENTFNSENTEISFPSQLIQNLADSFFIDYLERNYDDHEERLNDIKEVIKFAQGFYSLSSLMEQIALATDTESGETQPNLITCSSIHQAKGLEWKIVILIGLTEGLFPSFRAIEDGEKSIEEERRLFYVACTRAMDELYLMYSRLGSGWSSGAYEASRFIAELPEETFVYIDD